MVRTPYLLTISLQMKASCLAFSLLVLSIFLSGVEGIWLDKSFKSTGHPKLHEGAALMKKSYGVKADFVVCKEGHCTGKGTRKLLSATTAGTPTPITTSKKEDDGEEISKVKSFFKEKGGELVEFHVGSPATSEHQLVHDTMDIAEMDYSTARKKPPVHN